MRTIGYGILACAAAACADSAPDSAATTAPSEQDLSDVALSIASEISHDGGEVSAMREAAALARGERPADYAQADDGAFHHRARGLEYRYALDCQSTSGVAVAPCDATSAAAEVEAAWSGALDLPRLRVTVAHDARWQLSRMVGAIAHVDGTGHMSYTSGGDTGEFRYAYDVTYHAVIDDRRAIEGTMALAVTGEHTGAAPRRFAITADVAFSPDDTALVTLAPADEPGDVRRYRVGLATGALTALDASD